MRGTRSIRVALAAVLGVAFLLLASPAGAQDYPGGPTLTVSDTTPVCGDTITISGNDFEPNATVTITWNGEQIGTTQTNEAGSFSFSYTIPCPFTGPVNIQASDGVNVLGISISVGTEAERIEQPATAVGTLPRTGSDNGHLVRAAVALVAVGGLLVLATRRQTNKPVDA
jgi:LPXTG-motif cell wall-anchored protein